MTTERSSSFAITRLIYGDKAPLSRSHDTPDRVAGAKFRVDGTWLKMPGPSARVQRQSDKDIQSSVGALEAPKDHCGRSDIVVAVIRRVRCSPKGVHVPQ